MSSKGCVTLSSKKTFNPEVKLFESFIPLSENSADAVPVILSEDQSYLSRHLKDVEMNYAVSIGYFASSVNTALIPDSFGNLKIVLIKPSRKKRFLIGHRIAHLPSGNYRILTDLSKDEAFEVTLGFCLSSYKFQILYKEKNIPDVLLCIPDNVDLKRIKVFVQSEFFVRNLVNTPASQLGPNKFEDVIKSFAKERGASFRTLIGDDLLKENFPMIYAVGKAGAEAPRFIELNWGEESHYKVTLVGKGVCFDTGGLNIKLGESMSTMKKDMGGAACVLGLMECIIRMRLKVSLKVLIPIVENSIASQSLRPGDVLVSKKGLTVEVNNTDAEGRLILADALYFADEEKPDLLVSMATLTGAARVALGPDIAPFYCSDEGFSNALIDCSKEICDPVWRLPFYLEYESMIEPVLADLDNSPKTGMAGSITAALFLNKFVEKSAIFVHFDIFAWSKNAQPGRSVGGLMQGVRALYTALELTIKEH